MSQMSYWLVLISLVTSKIYFANSYALTANYISQLYYNIKFSIYIEDNNIDSIDPNAFYQYKMLNSIAIESNNMLTIDLEAFKYATNITTLSLKLWSLNTFTNSKNLKFPYLTQLRIYTNLTSLNKPMFNAFPALYRLDASNHNRLASAIKTIDVHTFESLSSLGELSLSLNSLTGFEYLQIPKNLKSLVLYGNKMNYFALSRTMGVLKYLDISNNLFRSFKSMDFTFLANLTELGLSNNPHAYPNEFSGHMKPLVKLERAYFNNLSINAIGSDFFTTNTKLQYIDLSDNKISSLGSGAFKGLNDLDTLLLDYNNLTKILSGTFNNSNLMILKINDNQISKLDESSFYGYSSVTNVNLCNNKLTKILPRTFINKFVSVSLLYNQITEIDNSTFDGAIEISYLEISYNKIEKIGPGSFSNVKVDYLYLSNNNLTEIRNGSFVGNLNYLDLSFNRIEKIEEGAFNYVSIKNAFFLNDNNLSEINATMFAGQNQLRYINLANNALSRIEPGSFANLPNLKDVYLENNQLIQLDISMFVGSNILGIIALNGNPNLSTANLQSLCSSGAEYCQVYY